MSYTDRGDFLEALGLGAWDQLEADDRVLVDQALAAGDTRVNDHCGRRFTVETEDRTVTYRPGYTSRDLLIGDWQTVTSVTDTGTALTASQWTLLAPAVEGHPHRWLRRLGGALWGARVAVTGRPGWDAVPAGAAGAAFLYARASYYTSKAKRGAEAVLPVNEVEGLLRPYRIPKIGGV